jgi:hypothetical protein
MSLGLESVTRVMKTGIDGTFVWADARPGIYTVVSAVPGFRPALARVFHRANRDVVTFVELDLERAGGILPQSPLGSADPWIARAVTQGDVLREVDEVLATDAADASPIAAATPATLSARAPAPLTIHPPASIRASLSSMAGFGADSESNLSRTSLDLSGTVGKSLRWGVEGQYSHSLVGDGSRGAGDSSRLAVDVVPGSDQSIHLSSRRHTLPQDDAESRFSAHAVDWSGVMSDRSQASVSARLISQSDLLRSGLAADLFARSSNAFEVLARYRTDFHEGAYVKVTVGYRAASGIDLVPRLAGDDRETRVGGVAGVRLFDILILEGGATGDYSSRTRGITPEATVAVQTEDGWRVYGSASRRYERRLDEQALLGLVGTEDADLTRLSRALYKGGIKYESKGGESVSIEASQRELGGTYRFLFDPDFVDRLDSLYFFPGDVASELASAATFHVGAGLDGRIAARAGTIHGERPGLVQRDDASFAVAEAALRVGWTGTSVGVGYRVVSQGLSRQDAVLRNDVSAVDFTLAQVVPLPVLRAIGSEWKALFSVELGRRREGTEDERANRRMAGGLALSF